MWRYKAERFDEWFDEARSNPIEPSTDSLKVAYQMYRKYCQEQINLYTNTCDKQSSYQ